MISTRETNYHSHCNYCDGKNEPEEYVKKAIELKMLAYGFSSHAPVPFSCEWCMVQEDLSSYLNKISELKGKYVNQLQIYSSLEIDYVPDLCGPQSEFIKGLNLDYTIGSVHFVDQFINGNHWEIDNTTKVFETGLTEIFNGDIIAAVKRYYSLIREMVDKQTPTIVGHLDKIKMHNNKKPFFDEKEGWYRKEVKETLEAISKSGAMIEVNTRGLYKKATFDFYPSNWVLEEILRLRIPITINSDAHTIEEITLGFDQAKKLLKQFGFKNNWILDEGEWKEVEIR